jgi:hypothetical protein
VQERKKKRLDLLFRSNIKLAGALWGTLTEAARDGLKELSVRYSVSVALGDVQLIDGRWYVTNSGLLRVANREHCSGIGVLQLRKLCDPVTKRWVFKATVYKSPCSRGFVGYGDADPSNVSTLVHGAEMRVAETRAVNRALRKAYGIGLCSVEELGSSSGPRQSSPARAPAQSNGHQAFNGSSNGQPRLRDQLCLLIRQHSLDPILVKAYAADFCGTATLSGATRELVESFISHLAVSAKENRDGLICKLNSYAQEVKP